MKKYIIDQKAYDDIMYAHPWFWTTHKTKPYKDEWQTNNVKYDTQTKFNFCPNCGGIIQEDLYDAKEVGK